MELTHTFTVPTDVETTWAHFEDIAGLAACFPGAQVTSVEGDTFSGTCKVKLGPIALTYAGSGTFTEKDDAAHRFVVDAKGKDKRGNGTAGAKVTLSMESGTGASDGGTDVRVLTDLAITGKPAQFGRGVMQDVSDKLLNAFVACLEQKLSADQGGGEPAAAAAEAMPSAPGDPETEPAVTPAAPAAGAAASASSSSAGSSSAASSGSSTAAPSRPATPPSDDALDLGAAVLPVLIKTYAQPVLAGVGVLAIIGWLVRRMRS